MTTAREIISNAMFDAGVVGTGQTANASDTNLALKRLNWMMAQWGKNRALVFHLIDVYFQSTAATSYTVGTGGNFNTPRPDKIHAAYARQTPGGGAQPVDYPIQILPSREDYSLIALKSLVTWPMYLFYDAAFPLGNLFWWPIPSALFQLHIVVKGALESFTTLDTDFELPPEYQEAIHYNLTARLGAAYGREMRAEVIALAKSTLNTIKLSNTAPPTMQMPDGLAGRRKNYNVYSDQNY